MVAEWVTVELGAVTDQLTGFPFKSSQYVEDPSAVRLLRGDNIAQGFLRWDGVKRWPRDAVDDASPYSLEEGDVVLAMDRPWIDAGLKYATLRQSDLPALLVQRVTRLRGTEQLETSFLKFVIGSKSFTDYILAVQTGTAVPHISGSQIRAYEFALPPLPEQRAVSHILGTLEDKVELNRKMNATLEAMARALFRDWFVDFGPTLAKMENREPYLAPDLWALFPDRLDEETGLPEGWRLGAVSDLIEFKPTESLKKGTITPYIDMASLPTSGSVTEPPILREFGSGMKFRDGDALLARITPCLENGKAAYIQGLGDGVVAWGSTEFIVMRARPPVPAPVSYLLARENDFRGHAIRSMTGTSGRQRAQADMISTYAAALPGAPALWNRLGVSIEPLFDRIAANAHESRTLAALRDLLLPKLISGEVRVKDAEKHVREAT